MLKLKITFIISLIACFAMSACLSQSLDYFSATVPVTSQSREEQAQAAKSGLLDVLVRVSGTEQVREAPVVMDRARKALSYVSQFQYADVENEALRDDGITNMLELKYSERLVRNILSDAGLPVWSTNRPKTLVWLVEDSTEHGKRMLAQDETNELVLGLQSAIEYRGLPLTYPLLDFDDQIALGAEKLWSLDEDAILKASERYKADVVLVGKFTRMSSGELWSNWQFFHRGKTRVYDLRDESAETVGYGAAVPLANYLASLYSVNSAESSSEYFSVNIDNIQNFADYRGLLNTINRLDTVKEVKVDKVVNDSIDLRLKSKASVDQLTSQLALGRKLFLQPNGDTAALPEWERAEPGTPQNPLFYRWER